MENPRNWVSGRIWGGGGCVRPARFVRSGRRRCAAGRRSASRDEAAPPQRPPRFVGRRNPAFRRFPARKPAPGRFRPPTQPRVPPASAGPLADSAGVPAESRGPAGAGRARPQRDDWRVAGARGARDFLKGFPSFPPLAGAKSPIFPLRGSLTWAHCTMRELPVRFSGPDFCANGMYLLPLCVRESPPLPPCSAGPKNTLNTKQF